MAIRFSYTPTGKRAWMTDTHGQTDYAYDVRDRMTMKVSPVGVLNYHYDERGNLSRPYSNTPNGVDLIYRYDALGRLERAIDARSGATVYQYDAVSKLLGYSYPNGVVTNHTFDALDRVLEVRKTKNNATLGGVAYRISPSGQRLGIDDLLGGTQRTYTYDDLYRLQNETIANDSTHAGAIGYLYDRVGNRLQRQSTVASITPQTFSYDVNDQISVSGFDDNGNTIDSTGELPGENYVDDYDFEDRLLRRTSNLRGVIAEFTYDGDGHRVSETTNGQTTEFLVDTQNPTGYAQVLEEHKAGTLATSYAYAHDLIAQHDQTTTGTLTHYFAYDALGTTRLLTDANGNVSDRFWYDAFGTLLKREGTTQTRYLYTGEQYSAAVGMYYLRARYYNESLGSFATLDSAKPCSFLPHLHHKFSYTANSPLIYSDPSGLERDLSSFTIANLVTRTIAFLRASYAVRTARTKAFCMICYVGIAGNIIACATPGLSPLCDANATMITIASCAACAGGIAVGTPALRQAERVCAHMASALAVLPGSPSDLLAGSTSSHTKCMAFVMNILGRLSRGI